MVNLGIHRLGAESNNLKYFFQAGDRRDVYGCVDAVARRINGELLGQYGGIRYLVSAGVDDPRTANARLVRKILEANRGGVVTFIGTPEMDGEDIVGNIVLFCSFDESLPQIGGIIDSLGIGLADHIHVALGRLSGVDPCRSLSLPENVTLHANMVQLTDGNYL